MTTPDPIAFTIFGLSVRWYGILIAAAIISGGIVMFIRAKDHGISADDVTDILLAAVPCGIVGARAYYVAFNWDYYRGSALRIMDFRAGGLAIHGGLILGLFGAYLMCRHKKIRFADALDSAAPGIALAQAIGRWGNFFNGEAHGGPTDLPWGIIVDGVRVHPTFLYESIWCLMLFFFLMWLDRHRAFEWQTFLSYAFLYSLERFFVEHLRTDSLMIGPFKQAQVLSAAVMLACAVTYVILYRKNKKQKSASAH
ncbi:MAG: prolipoprotein diacylglyceryl transferase [Anaerovoracaceae bacterium]